jgi:hypothetical protein
VSLFRRVFPKAGALAYLGEAGAHVWVLTHKNFSLERLPLAADGFFLVLGGPSTLGLWRYRKQITFRTCRSCVAYWFTLLHITVSVVLHGYIVVFDRKHRILRIFPRCYSVLGLAYCLFFTRYLWTFEVPDDNVADDSATGTGAAP